MTLRDLIQQLEALADEHGDDTEVRLASQPQWPFEYAIAQVVAASAADGDEEDNGVLRVGELDLPIVYVGEGRQLGYLPGCAAEALGWAR